MGRTSGSRTPSFTRSCAPMSGALRAWARPTSPRSSRGCSSSFARIRALRARLGQQYRAIAVDELQDINRPQFELLRLAVPRNGAVCSASGIRTRPSTGSAARTGRYFFEFAAGGGRARHSRCGATTDPRRSSCSSADAVISLDRSPEVPPLVPVRPHGEQVMIAPCADPAEEGRFIASEIRDLVGGVDSVSVEAARARKPGEYAFRTSRCSPGPAPSATHSCPACSDAGLPLHLGVHAPLSEEEPFRSVVAALRLVLNPSDVVARRILSDSGDAADAILARGPELSRAAAQRHLRGPGPHRRSDRGRSTVPCPRSRSGKRPSALPRRATDRTSRHFSRTCRCARGKARGRAPRRGSPCSPSTPPRAWSSRWCSSRGRKKGITPLEDERGVDLAEERRLFYVAMTRARDACASRTAAAGPGAAALERMRPSRFLDDIPAGLRIGCPPRRPRRAALTFLSDAVGHELHHLEPRDAHEPCRKRDQDVEQAHGREMEEPSQAGHVHDEAEKHERAPDDPEAGPRLGTAREANRLLLQLRLDRMRQRFATISVMNARVRACAIVSPRNRDASKTPKTMPKATMPCRALRDQAAPAEQPVRRCCAAGAS